MKLESVSKRCILVVDDEPDYRDMLRWYLEGEGYRVEVAGDGEQAMASMAAGRIDLIVTDLTMPCLDGLKLLERIKQVAPATHVIVMTGFSAIETAVHAMQKGAYDFLLKPFNLDHLLARIREAFSEEQLVQ